KDLVLRFVPPPVITCPANVTAQCASAVPAAAADSAGFIAQGGTISSSCGGTLTVGHSDVTTAGSCPNNFMLTRTYTVSDACGTASASCVQSIAVNDTTAPSITCLGNKIVECAAAWSFDTPTATDNCGGSPTITVVDTVTNTT